METENLKTGNEMLDKVICQIADYDGRELDAAEKQKLQALKDLKDILEEGMIPGHSVTKTAFHKG